MLTRWFPERILLPIPVAMQQRSKKIRRRVVLAGAGLLAIAGTVSAGHAENAGDAALLPTAQDALDPASNIGLPHFQSAFEAPVPEEAMAATERDLGEGVASWYGPRFAGRLTANGESFDPSQLTAAHRTLPFGSMVKVTFENTGKSVVVRINDRGPFHGNRVIDLSQAAAKEIGITGPGKGRVTLALLES